MLPAFAGHELAIDATVALRCARLHEPGKLSERDALIAASQSRARLAVAVSPSARLHHRHSLPTGLDSRMGS